MIMEQRDLTSFGDFFSVGVHINMVTAGVDNGLVLLRNPIGNSKIVFVHVVRGGVAVTNTFAVYSLWFNPTTSAAGTPLTPFSPPLIDNVALAPTALVTTLPTVTSLGNNLVRMVCAQNANSVDVMPGYSITVNPGNSLLIAGRPAANGRESVITLSWTEK